MASTTDRLAPQDTVSEADLRRGCERVVLDSAYASATTALTSGVILTALALRLGASTFVLGLLASAPFLGQLLQGFGILLVEKLRRRKQIAVIASVVGRSMLLLMAAAVFLPPAIGLGLVVLAQFVLCGANAIGVSGWNPWLRDLIPERKLGAIAARRNVWATIVSLVAGLLAAFTLDRPDGAGATQASVFAGLYVVDFATGMVSAWITAGIPEPRMPPAESRVRLLPLLREPLRDANFRRLIVFLAAWQFAANLATPFFTVYLLEQLGLDLTLVMLLSVVTQLANLAAVRSWGC